jgi:DNA-binding winged helix-turn-helix (wHTH) protein/Tfp pilus assembly protein PilF
MDTSIGSIIVGEWRAMRATGELSGPTGAERLEPKVMDLLFLLASRPGEAFSKDQIMDALWPGVVVGEDTLARTVSRLRKALGDETKAPRYIETLPKRGYRLIAPVSTEATAPARLQPQANNRNLPTTRRTIAVGAAAVALVALAVMGAMFWSSGPAPKAPPARQVLIDRANDFYFQFHRADNEAAIQLFERLLAEDPDYAPALAGLANALVQKVIRWPDEPGAKEVTRLGDALKSGRTQTAAARVTLARAQTYAERAVSLAPSDPETHKALGFVLAARQQFDPALDQYREAVRLDANAWGALINMGDVLEISGRPGEALPHFEEAYAAMGKIYQAQSARIRPWYADLGVLIGKRHKAEGSTKWAEVWFRRVLDYAPLHQAATSELARLLRETGRTQEADERCANLMAKASLRCTTD